MLPDNFNNFIREENIFLNPFSFLKFNEKPDEFYPISDVAQEKPMNQEVNIGRSLMITHARRSARKYYYHQDTFHGVDDVLPYPQGAPALADCAYVNAFGTAQPSEVVAGRAELSGENFFSSRFFRAGKHDKG